MFVVDIAYERGMYPEDVLPPWKRAEEFIKPAVNSWEQRGVVTLTQCFKERNRHGAKPMMLSYCAIYIQLMHWINEEPVRSLQTVPEYLKSMPYAPMNLEERLFFILQAPDHHHAFTTLMQLFSESVKKWAVFQLRNK
ncbi:hypothetical protein SAMN05421736_10486 [Evansella caseinilytica]|uniref:YpoC-like domain-containing protein n=1 Tax=Evansella caseinilytica TaxID=1503961 RepID=A0A1H3NJF7_9BACI|nr:hypothetical protein SAMN05421736_10486 [Evansella caseinilytica]